MKFPQSVREKVKQKSRGLCPLCWRPMIEIHHINKELKNSELQKEDNAIPLCGWHHSRYQDTATGKENAALRKWLKETRDRFYDDVRDPQFKALLEQIEDLKSGESNQKWLTKQTFITAQESLDFYDFKYRMKKLSYTGTFETHFGKLNVCDNCKTELFHISEYCPKCGAKIDGGAPDFEREIR